MDLVVTKKQLEEGKMVQFYRMEGEEMEFQLLNINVVEDFSVWDKVNKIFLRQVPGVNNMDDLKFMKKDLFIQTYPNLTKKISYVRNISVNAQSYLFAFTGKANKQIDLIVQDMNVSKQDPLSVKLRMRKIGTGINTEYYVTGLGTFGRAVLTPLQEANAQYNITPLISQAPIGNATSPMVSCISKGLVIPPVKEELIGYEKLLMKDFNDYAEYCSLARFLEIAYLTLAKDNKTIIPMRLEELYNKHYKK